MNPLNQPANIAYSYATTFLPVGNLRGGFYHPSIKTGIKYTKFYDEIGEVPNVVEGTETYKIKPTFRDTRRDLKSVIRRMGTYGKPRKDEKDLEEEEKKKKAAEEAKRKEDEKYRMDVD